jgi:FdhE protein
MKDGSKSKSQRTNKDFQKLRALDYIPEKHVDFFEAVTTMHTKTKGEHAKDEILPSLSKEAAKKVLSEGFPLINCDQLKVKVGPLRAHLKDICNLLAEYETSEPGPVASFCKSENFKRLDLKTFVRRTVSQNGDYLKQLSGKTGVDENTLRFMGVTLARPLFELAAAQVKNGINENENVWWKNYCPVCGSEPFMAWIRKADNMRFLGCSLCGTEWKFDRVTCPYCNNKDHERLKFFYFHEGSPHRLYVCDACKRYIKCIDQRKTEVGQEINLSVEDMVTLYLDTLAREKGYVSGEGLKGTDNQESTSK